MTSRKIFVTFLWVLLASRSVARADPAADAKKAAVDMVKRAGMAPMGRFVTFVFSAKDFGVHRELNTNGGAKTIYLTLSGNASLKFDGPLAEGFKTAVGPFDRTGFKLMFEYRDPEQYRLVASDCVQIAAALAAQPSTSTRKLTVDVVVAEREHVIFMLPEAGGSNGNSVTMSDAKGARPAQVGQLPISLSCTLR